SPGRRGDRLLKLSAGTADTTAERLDTARRLQLRVDFGAAVHELRCLLFQSLFDCRFFCEYMFRSVLPNIFGDSHRTKMRTAHTAKVCRLRAFSGKSFVVEFARGFGIE